MLNIPDNGVFLTTARSYRHYISPQRGRHTQRAVREGRELTRTMIRNLQQGRNTISKHSAYMNWLIIDVRYLEAKESIEKQNGLPIFLGFRFQPLNCSGDLIPDWVGEMHVIICFIFITKTVGVR